MTFNLPTSGHPLNISRTNVTKKCRVVISRLSFQPLSQEAAEIRELFCTTVGDESWQSFFPVLNGCVSHNRSPISVHDRCNYLLGENGVNN